MTAGDIVREYFPDATDDECEFILWEKTGYPCFWNIPEDGSTPEECFRHQLGRFKLARDTGRKLCSICGAIYIGDECSKHEWLDKIREAGDNV